MPEPITDDQLRELREALGDQVPAIWMHRNAWAWLAALCDEVELLRGERNRLLYYAEAAEDGRSVLAAKLSAVRQLLAEHPGSAWDSGIKLQAALKAALDGS